MDSIDNSITATPNKRKLRDERDDDIVVTPSSSYDSESDDSTRDTDSFVSTPISACESTPAPHKRRRMSHDTSQLSPPLMPRFQYRPSSLIQYNDRSHPFARGRPVLDIFEGSSTSLIEDEQPEDDMSFLAIPTPPSIKSEADDTKIPVFDLSPRTTLAPRFPELMDSHRLFGNPSDEKENDGRRPLLPSLRMRRSRPQEIRVGNKEMLEELSLPTLTLRESLPAVAA